MSKFNDLTSPTNIKRFADPYRLKPHTSFLDDPILKPKRNLFTATSNQLASPKSPEQFKEYLMIERSKRQEEQLESVKSKCRDLERDLYGKDSAVRNLQSGLLKARQVTSTLESKLQKKEGDVAEMDEFWRSRNRQLEQQLVSFENRLMQKQKKEAEYLAKLSELQSKVDTSDRQIAKFRDENSRATDELAQMYENQIKELKASYEKRLETTQSTIKEDILATQRHLKGENARNEGRFKEMSAMYEKQLKSMREIHEMSVKDRETYFEEELQIMEEKIKAKENFITEFQSRVKEIEASKDALRVHFSKKETALIQERNSVEQASNKVISNLRMVLEHEKVLRAEKEKEVDRLSVVNKSNGEKYQNLNIQLEKELQTLKSHIQSYELDVQSLRSRAEGQDAKYRKLEREYDACLEQLHERRSELQAKNRENHELTINLENTKADVQHAQRTVFSMQESCDKLKDQLSSEREGDQKVISELRSQKDMVQTELHILQRDSRSLEESSANEIEALKRKMHEVGAQRDLIYGKLQQSELGLLEVSKDLQESRSSQQSLRARLDHLRETSAPLDKYQQAVTLCTQLEKGLGQTRVENHGLKATNDNLRGELRELHITTVSLQEYDECAKRVEEGQRLISRLKSEVGESRTELERLAQSCQSAKVAVIKAQTEIDHGRMNEQQLRHTISELEDRSSRLNAEARQSREKLQGAEDDKRHWRQKCVESGTEMQTVLEQNAKLLQRNKWAIQTLKTIVNSQTMKKIKKSGSHNMGCATMSAGHWVRLTPAQHRKIKKHLERIAKQP